MLTEKDLGCGKKSSSLESVYNQRQYFNAQRWNVAGVYYVKDGGDIMMVGERMELRSTVIMLNGLATCLRQE